MSDEITAKIDNKGIYAGKHARAPEPEFSIHKKIPLWMEEAIRKIVREETWNAIRAYDHRTLPGRIDAVTRDPRRRG